MGSDRGKKQSSFSRDPRLIAGALREALFHRRRVRIRLNQQIFEADWIRLIEGSTRNRSESREAELRLHSSGAGLSQALDGTIWECSFPDFVLRWTLSTPINCDDRGVFRIPLPEEIEILNSRSAERISPLHSSLSSTRVWVSSSGTSGEGIFKLEDLSDGGFGGILQISDRLPLGIGANISGYLSSFEGGVLVGGKVQNLQLLHDSTEGEFETVYRVGCSRVGSSSELRPSSGNRNSELDRRAYPREWTPFEVTLLSPLNPKIKLNARTLETSVAGFAAEFRNSTDRNLLPVGIVAQIEGTTLRVKVVSQSERQLGFQIVSASSSDRSLWLRKRQGARVHGQHNRHHASGTGQNLIRLFCESGAFSSEYLRLNSRDSESLRQGLASSVSESAWLHRSIEQADSGRAVGHVSAVRMGDSLWHLGDVAGANREGESLSENFIPGFLTSFKDFCLESSPCPQVVVTWNDGHPYWEKYSQFLKSVSRHYISSWLRVVYRRNPEIHISGLEVSSFEFAKVLPTEHQRIRGLLSELRAKGWSEMAQALDFTVERFGSPELSRSIEESGSPFLRRYVEVRSGSERALVILSRFPLGSSPHRTLDVPWIFPLTLKNDPESSLRFQGALREYAAAEGFFFPGVIEALSEEESVQAATSIKGMNWILGHPRILDFFEVKK